MANTYDDGCKLCCHVPTHVKVHEIITIQPANSADSFGPFEADSYYCNSCFTRMLAEILNRIE